MNRMHRMPFGAEPRSDGHTRFRLWAPCASQVEVALYADDGDVKYRSMQRLQRGWFETLAEAPVGTRYRFRIDGGVEVPDPASRYNPDDVHGPSAVTAPLDFTWADEGWQGAPWERAVIYELHVGCFTPEGTFAGVEGKLDYLRSLGITALELMPVAEFPGRRGWGYDGVLPFAPDASYGHPDDLKRLVQAAHRAGLMMFLDVVYNHFGPEGNYLHSSAPAFFTARHRTPWGDGINFDGEHSEQVRAFFVHNALYWLDEFHFDGLRLDAVHAIVDDSASHFLDELALTVRRSFSGRAVHLVLENDANEARWLRRDASGAASRFDAQWNDDFHHALRVAATGETNGYYADYAADPVGRLGRCLAEGFAYQGERSPFRGGAVRGESSVGLPPTAFVGFIQNHDQVGNRPYGERLSRLVPESTREAMMAILLLSPSPPMLFMGDEFAASTPFLYFCDFAHDLAAAVTAGRQREFAALARDADAGTIAEPIPDPASTQTFEHSKIDWSTLDAPVHSKALESTRSLLSLRRRFVVPLLAAMKAGAASCVRPGPRALLLRWPAGAATWWMLANLGDEPITADIPAGNWIHRVGHVAANPAGRLGPWSVLFGLDGDGRQRDA
jgi:maltooligosyltrehalose trehalohydrolase